MEGRAGGGGGGGGGVGGGGGEGGGGGGGGGGKEMRSESKKQCSHNLQSGHLAWWSADNIIAVYVSQRTV